MGVLDKYRVRGNRGQLPVKGLFNPGRNQQWDWNELLQTIENNFSTDDSDLAALTARVTTAEDNIVSNDADIATNTGEIESNATAIGTNITSIATTNTALETLTSQTSEMGAQVELNKTEGALLRAQIVAICDCLVAAEIACENCGKDPEEERR